MPGFRFRGNRQSGDTKSPQILFCRGGHVLLNLGGFEISVLWIPDTKELGESLQWNSWEKEAPITYWIRSGTSDKPVIVVLLQCCVWCKEQVRQGSAQQTFLWFLPSFDTAGEILPVRAGNEYHTHVRNKSEGQEMEILWPQSSNSVDGVKCVCLGQRDTHCRHHLRSSWLLAANGGMWSS